MSHQRAVFTGPGRVEVQAFDPGVPGPGEVRLQTVATALSAGTESLLWRGLWPRGMPLDSLWASAPGSAHYPVVFGYASVGRVEALGLGVDRTLAGKLAFTFTGHQSSVVVPAQDLLLLPEGLDTEDGVFLAAMETALSLAQDAAPVAGERVGLWGLGTIGLLTAQLLDRVQAWDALESRRARARELGLQTARPTEASCDVTVELTGNPAALDEAIRATRFSGRVVVGSWYGEGSVPLTLGGEFHRSRIQLIASQVSTVSPVLSGRWTKARRWAQAWEYLQDLRPSRLVTHRFPLAEASRAYAQACDHPESGLQVLFTYGPEAKA